MLKRIQDDLDKRMRTHVNPMCATDDEVSIAWLLCHIDELQGKLNDAKEENRHHKSLSRSRKREMDRLAALLKLRNGGTK